MTEDQAMTHFLGAVEFDIPEMAGLPDACFDTETDDMRNDVGEVSVRLVAGHLVRVQPAACPLHQDMAEFGVEPVCEISAEHLCCTEFGARTRSEAVRCGALLAPRTKEQPMVALIALQQREKLPPPHTLN